MIDVDKKAATVNVAAFFYLEIIFHKLMLILFYIDDINALNDLVRF